MMKLPAFGLEDIPKDWDIELDAEFVRFLDTVNRPWKYDRQGRFLPKARHHPNEASAFWESGWYSDKRPRYKALRTEGYFKRHNLFEKLWGYHRYHDAHVARYGYIKNVDTGNWIKRTDIEVIREAINMSDEDFEEVIVGFRKGKFNHRNERVLRFERLPIVANKHWAWLLGFYYGAGMIYFRDRYYEGAHHEATIRLKFHEEVLPLFLEHHKHLGANKIFYDDAPKSHAIRDKGLGTTVRRQLLLGWPEYLVLKKFGLSTFFETEKPDDHSASRAFKPFIPTWVKNNDEIMQSFIEGYINTVKGCSVLNSVAPRIATPGHPHLTLFIRCNGRPDEYVRQFILDLSAWFKKHGINHYSRRYARYKVPGRSSYELSFHTRKARMFFAKHFEIRRSEFRARLLIRLAADQSAVVYEILRRLRTPDNVILGMLFEKPRTKEDIQHNLQMHHDGLTESLLRLQLRGLIVKQDKHYQFEPARWLQNVAQEKKKLIEHYHELCGKLLHKCPKCQRIFMVKRTKCGICGEKLVPTNRQRILTGFNVRIQQLKEVIAC